MKTIRSLSEFEQLPASSIRDLIGERLTMLEEYGVYSPRLGWFLIVEAGDKPEYPEDWPCPPLLLDSADLPIDAPGYFSPYEFCVRHDCGVFELVRVVCDDGESVAIFVPDRPEISVDLLRLCRTLEAVHANPL